MTFRVDFQVDGNDAHIKVSSQVENAVNEAVWNGEDAGEALLEVLAEVLSGEEYTIKRD